MEKPEYPIAVAARRSSVSSHTIRAWEKRYGAIVPTRSGTQRRLYSDADIERITLLRHATLAGHTISSIAKLSNAALLPLAAEGRNSAPRATPGDAMLAAAWDAVVALDAGALDRLLRNAAMKVGRGALTKNVLVPLIEKVGAAWQDGTLRVVHEHLATSVIRTFLGAVVQAHSLTSNAPVLVATTLPGQHHELGALIAGSIATDHGWRVVYLGTCLPPEEIAAAAQQSNADALALSFVYPADDSGLAAQLQILRQLVPELPILVGGRSVHGYAAELKNIDETVCQDVAEIATALDEVRATRHRDRR